MKSASKAMDYEKAGETRTPKKTIDKLETDINRLSTFRVIRHLYKKHELSIMYVVSILSITWAVVEAL